MNGECLVSRKALAGRMRASLVMLSQSRTGDCFKTSYSLKLERLWCEAKFAPDGDDEVQPGLFAW